MKALLDTHTFLWWLTDDPRLSPKARETISDGRSEIYLSAASAWEIAIKAGRGKLILPEPPGAFIARRMSIFRFHSLPVQISHAVRVFELPHHHNDPYDRMLVAQSQLESIPLLTKDEEILRYEVETIW